MTQMARPRPRSLVVSVLPVPAGPCGRAAQHEAERLREGDVAAVGERR